MRVLLILIAMTLILSGCAQQAQDIPEEIEPQGEECVTDANCVRSGCSGTVCQSEDREPIMTTCEWREEYSCFQEIRCGCTNGFCGWPDDGTLDACIASKIR